MRRRWMLAGAGALAVLLTGCASAGEPDVAKVATAFEDPSGDPQARCDLLAPATLATFESDSSAPCADALADVPLRGGTVGSVEIWGGDAQVRLGADTLFLTRTDTGWKVTAAGCESRGEPRTTARWTGREGCAGGLRDLPGRSRAGHHLRDRTRAGRAMSSAKEPGYGFVRNNALSLAFGALFLITLVGQAISGVADFNAEQVADGLPQVGFLDYVTSSSFAVDVMENWQSEYLQFLLYIFATVWLVQKGSSESKDPGDEGTESDEEQRLGRHAQVGSPLWARVGGWRTAVFSRSLGLLMGGLFLLTWAASAIAGWAAFNSLQLGQRQDPVTFLGYLGEADFWNRSFQNWQSEMLAVGSMAIFAVYLRQRGSPESKPVGVAHADTGQTG